MSAPPFSTSFEVAPRGVLVDSQIAALIGTAIKSRAGAPTVDLGRQLQPASLDVRLGGRVLVPSEDSPMNTVVQQRIEPLLRSRTQI